jgi:phosphate transport system substrate-binding protein
MKKNRYFLALTLAILFLLACSCKSHGEKQLMRETPTRGDIRIAVDESYKLLADSQLATFTSLYKYASIEPVYASEDSVLSLFMADSVRLMIISRKLTANEEAYLKNKQIVARTTQIAWDGVAFIVNRKNRDDKIRYASLREIFTGARTQWSDINSFSRLGNIQVVFDNQGSGNIRYLMKKFGCSVLPEYCYATNSNPDVIAYVESHPNALGVISVNWISDPDDSVTHDFLNRVQVVGLTPEFNSEGNDFYTPHPAYLADKSYPFIREVYAVGRETFSGLGSGFIQFVAGDQGQRIVLKSGMVPSTMPVRIIQIRKE